MGKFEMKTYWAYNIAWYVETVGLGIEKAGQLELSR